MPIPIIPLAIIFGGAIVVNKLLSAANVSDKVQVLPENLTLKFTWINGLTIKTDIRLQNPTMHGITITQPFVKLLNGETLLASNTIKSNITKIDKMSEAVLKNLTFNVSILQLGLNAKNIFANVVQGEKLLKGYDLKLEYSLFADGIPITSVQPIKIAR